MLVVALPVVGGVVAGQIRHNSEWTGAQTATSVMGSADGTLKVTPYRAVSVKFDGDSMVTEPVAGTGRRPVGSYGTAGKVTAVLPAGAAVVQAPVYGSVDLAYGGTSQVLSTNASSPLLRGVVSVVAGTAPRSSGEVAVGRAMATELGLLDEGRLRASASVALADGEKLHVTGLLSDGDAFGSDVGASRLLVAPNSPLVGKVESRSYLVDLKSDSPEAIHSLVDALAAEGLVFTPRDAYLDPAGWGAPPAVGDDGASAAVGGVAVGAAAALVILIVGAAFSIGARRRVRELGLLAAVGAGPADIRRSVLAQGLILGSVGAVCGACVGTALFYVVAPVYEQVTGTRVWSRDLGWTTTLLVAAVQIPIVLVAVLLPAISMSRAPVVEALNGEFERPGRRDGRARLFWGACVPVALVALVACGLLVARLASNETLLYRNYRPLLAATGVATVVGLIAAVQFGPQISNFLSFRTAGRGFAVRYALRETARSRTRTMATILALAATVTASVVAVFAITSATARSASDVASAHLLNISVDGTQGAEVRTLKRLQSTVNHVVGQTEGPPAGFVVRKAIEEHHNSQLVLLGANGENVELSIVNLETLSDLFGVHDSNVLAAFESGDVVSDMPGVGNTSSISFARDTGSVGKTWPVSLMSATFTDHSLGPELAFISTNEATRLGLAVVPMRVTYRAAATITANDLDRLAVYGVGADTTDVQATRLARLRYGTLGVLAIVTTGLIGVAVALAAGEGTRERHTLRAIGAPPRSVRSLSAATAGIIGANAAWIGILVGGLAGTVVSQINGLSGTQVPWAYLAATAFAVPAAAALVGWLGAKEDG